MFHKQGRSSPAVTLTWEALFHKLAVVWMPPAGFTLSVKVLILQLTLLG